ncbi:hypothetical protein DM01DRAFT_1407601 [Hesseltinella vesiculosa]|uniref:Uncharacterized protein n=1 Tax=Hesseltinella vesiculosa TaxID=101127 RepID=A0A1X2GHX0_9FUNG|nr:hypothetical protein DM01DRAFT_1407601 [Hesseltinella vesiculosa]
MKNLFAPGLFGSAAGSARQFQRRGLHSQADYRAGNVVAPAFVGGVLALGAGVIYAKHHEHDASDKAKKGIDQDAQDVQVLRDLKDENPPQRPSWEHRLSCADDHAGTALHPSNAGEKAPDARVYASPTSSSGSQASDADSQLSQHKHASRWHFGEDLIGDEGEPGHAVRAQILDDHGALGAHAKTSKAGQDNGPSWKAAFSKSDKMKAPSNTRTTSSSKGWWRDTKDRADEAMEDDLDEADEAAADAKAAANQAQEKTKHWWQSAKNDAQSAMDDVQREADAAVDDMKKNANEAADHARHWWQSAKDDAQSAATDAQHAADNVKNEVDQATDKAHHWWQAAKDDARAAIDQADREVDAVMNDVKSEIDQATDKARHWWQSAKDDTQSAMDQAGRDADAVVDDIKNQADDAAGKARHWWQSAKEDAQSAVDEANATVDGMKKDVDEAADQARHWWQSAKNDAQSAMDDAQRDASAKAEAMKKDADQAAEKTRHWWQSSKNEAESAATATTTTKQPSATALNDAHVATQSWRDAWDLKVNELNDRAASGTDHLKERLHEWSTEAHNTFDRVNHSQTSSGSSTASTVVDHKMMDRDEWESIYADASQMVNDAKEELDRAERIKRQLEQIKARG